MTSQPERESTSTSETARPGLEPCSRCGTRGPFELAYISQWLRVAHEDAVEAEGSASARHALFWVQQSVEKLYKAYFLMGDDVCYCEVVREVGHDTLKSFLQLTEKRIGNPVNRPGSYIVFTLEGDQDFNSKSVQTSAQANKRRTA